MNARTRVTIAASLVLGVACVDSTTSVTPAVVNAAGRYGLTTVNDTVLPRTIQTKTDYLLEILADTIVLNSNGQWADGTLYRETSTAGVQSFSNVIGGLFEVSTDGQVSFHSNNGSFTGTVSGSTLTIVGAAKAVYRK